MKPFLRVFRVPFAGLALVLILLSPAASAANVRLLPTGGNLLDARVGFGETARPVLFFANNISPVFEQKAGEPFLLTRTVPAPDGEGLIEQIIARHDPLPEGVNAVLYLLTPAAPGGHASWRLIPIIEDERAVKRGSVRVLNFSSLTIAVLIGEENGAPAIIPPQDQAVLHRVAEQSDVRIEVAGRTEGVWELVVGQNYGFHPSERNILLVTPGVIGPTGETNGLLTTTLIRERIQEPPPTQE